MTAYNEGTLDKLSKKELIGITLSRQNKVEQYTNVNADALEEIRKFNENFIKLESKINIVKKVNVLLNKRVIDMDTMQSKCPVFKKGVFGNCGHSSLESKVVEVFSKVGCEILSRNIEACHRLTNNDRIIV